MNLSIEELQVGVVATGFPIETLDRVIRLIDLQNTFEATHLSRTRSSLQDHCTRILRRSMKHDWGLVWVVSVCRLYKNRQSVFRPRSIHSTIKDSRR